MPEISNQVRSIIEAVRQRGDKALCEFAQRFDKIRLQPRDLVVSARELKDARKKVSPAFLKAIQESARAIESFAREEKKRLLTQWTVTQGSARVGQLVRAVDSVGLYIPGGRFPYPSTVLMTAIPARIAGVQRIVMASPPKNLTPEVLAAAAYAGCETVFRVGGAGAIAAMAYGTERIPPVDFIVGPGNPYVTEAKRQVFGQVGIDSLAGPSEVVIIADRTAPVDAIQADLSAQAEHDPQARAVLFSTDAALITQVRRGIDPSIKNRIHLCRVKNLDAAFEEVNRIAPEHLELLIAKPERFLAKVRHAGAVFLGTSTPTAIGDYVAGPSHVLPTNRSARFSSGLSVATFLKRSSVIGFKARSSERSRWEAALTLAQTEGMKYHARSLRCRVAR
ncbi:MAG: histidinol dehydrogenase [Elusimicrobiota bacterium]|jgi:histidinol dehydrogenase